MPTVARFDGFRVMIYTNDHTPKHVHVAHGGDAVVIYLEDRTIREVNGMKPALVRQALDWVAANQAFLISEWDRIGPIP